MGLWCGAEPDCVSVASVQDWGDGVYLRVGAAALYTFARRLKEVRT